MKSVAAPTLPDWGWVHQFNRPCWIDRRDSMFVDDLRNAAPLKLYSEVVEPFDLALEPDPVHEEHRHINFVVAQVIEEGILKD
jgi:hypothetical protein